MQPANDNTVFAEEMGWTLRERYHLAKAIIAKHYPDGGAPEGLMMSMVKAMGLCHTAGINWAYRVHGHQGEPFEGPSLDGAIAEITSR